MTSNRFIKLTTVAITVFLIISCASESDTSNVESTSLTILDRHERINNTEQRLMNIINTNPHSADYLPTTRRLIEEYRQFAHYFPNDEQAAEMLFRAANLQADATQDYVVAIGTFNRIIREYPETDQARRSLFLIGYTYSEHLEDYENAQKVYEEFLEKYPDDELAAAVESELLFMGKSLDEIMNELGIE